MPHPSCHSASLVQAVGTMVRWSAAMAVDPLSSAVVAADRDDRGVEVRGSGRR